MSYSMPMPHNVPYTNMPPQYLPQVAAQMPQNCPPANTQMPNPNQAANYSTTNSAASTAISSTRSAEIQAQYKKDLAPILQESAAIQAESVSVLQESAQVFQETLNAYNNNIKSPSNNVKFEPSDDNILKMTELGPNGTPVKKSTFDTGKLIEVKKYLPDGKSDVYHYDKTNANVQKGYIKYPNGDKHIDKEYEFCKGYLDSYEEGTDDTNESSYQNKKFSYDDDTHKLQSYTEGNKIIYDEGKITKTEIYIDNQ